MTTASSDLNDPDYWNRAIAIYESMAAPFTQHFARSAWNMLDAAAGKRVLDVGCGTGAFAIVAADAGADVVAIDFAPAMVERVRQLQNPRIEARQMDGQALDLPSESFDAVASVFGVMLFPDWRAGLREMVRVTRRGGSGVVASWVHPDGAAINLLLGELRRKLFPNDALPSSPAGMLALASPEAMRTELAAAGYSDIRCQLVQHDFLLQLHVLDDADRYFGILPLWTSLQPSQRSQLLAGIRARVAQIGATDVLAIASTALIAMGRKD
jgi:SAM-dependent methyltransferase